MEIHLGGFSCETLADSGDTVLIDTHAGPIGAPVWPLYAHALRRFGPHPTLIEWDNDLPSFERLLVEAERTGAVIAEVFPGDSYVAVG